MQAYRHTGLLGEEKGPYFTVMRDAHDMAKAELKGHNWSFAESRIELVEIDIDKKAICDLLSGWGCEVRVRRTWALTPRGGLKEVANGE